jgi:uncharacterized membrane protein YeaQ/YmgE (transglycosylase-associated protein family)
MHNNVALRRRVGPTDQRSLRDFRFPPDRYQIAALRQMTWRAKGRHTDGRGHLHCELNSRRSLVLGPRYHEIHEYWQAAVVRDARECAELSLFAGALRLGRRRARELNPAFAERLPFVSNIIWIIVIGFVAGLIARFVSPGPNGPSGFILTTVLGIVGAFVATFIGQLIGWYQLDQGAGLIGATVGAVIVLFIWNRLVVHHVIGDPGVGPQGRRP